MSAPRGDSGDGVELPTIYQRVEYLMGGGEAYIDLGVKNKTTFGIKYKIGGQFWCGAANGTGYGVGGGWMGGGDVQFASGNDWNPIWFVPQTPFTISSNYMGSGECYVDDTYIRPFTKGANSDFNFFLFGYSNYEGTRIYGGLPGPLHHFQLTDGQTLVMDLWPCYRKSDGVAGMFDLVTRKFFTNAASTGAFTCGADIPSHTPYLVFVDPAVEAICVQNWGDGVGLTMQDAAAVTSQQLGTTFQGNTQITSFDELQYFTGLTSLPSYAFQNCTSLQRVSIPPTLLSDQYCSFIGCSSLSEVTFVGSVNFAGQSSTFRSTAITRVNLDRMDYGFVTAALTRSRVNVNGGGPQGIGIYVNGTQILSFTAPAGTTTVEPHTFRDISTNEIILPDSVTSIGNSAFFSPTIGKLVLYSTTPPTISDKYDVGAQYFPKYVPYSADHSILNAYKTASSWANLSGYIYELNPDGTIPS